MKQSLGIGIGAGLVSALLFGVLLKATPLAIVLYLLAPLPILIVGLGWSHKAALVAAATGSLALALVVSPFLGLGFGTYLALPAWWLAYLALLGRPRADGQLEWYPTGRLLRPIDRWLAIGFVVVQGAWTLAKAYAVRPIGWWDCPTCIDTVDAQIAALQALDTLGRIETLALTLLSLGLLVAVASRWARASGAARRRQAPVVLVGGDSGSVGRDYHVVHAPQRMLLRQRLLFKDVERGPGDPPLPQRLRQPPGHRHVPSASALWHGHVAFPFRTCHGQLPFGEVDVGPLERDDLAASQPRLAAQQNNQDGQRFGLSHVHEPFEFVEVVEARLGLRRFQQLD